MGVDDYTDLLCHKMLRVIIIVINQLVHNNVFSVGLLYFSILTEPCPISHCCHCVISDSRRRLALINFALWLLPNKLQCICPTFYSSLNSIRGLYISGDVCQRNKIEDPSLWHKMSYFIILNPGGTYMLLWTGSSLILAMAWHRMVEHKVAYYWLDFGNNFQWNQ